MSSDLRKTGLSVVAELPWGSHFAQFYRTEEDLREILVPYLQAGLQANELCVWVTSESGDEEAVRALQQALPQLREYLRSGQMEIIPWSRWQAMGQGWGSPVVCALDRGIIAGFQGVRLVVTALPEHGETRAPRAEIDDVSMNQVVALFAYPRDQFDAAQLMEIVKDHRFALVRNGARWSLIESSEARVVKDELRRVEEKMQSVFSNMSEGFAYHRIVLDQQGRAVDYVFLQVNHAFERLTGLKSEDVVGRKVTEVIPEVVRHPEDLIGRYGKVALSGEPARFEIWAETHQTWFAISAFSPHRGYFAVTFSDVTDRRRADTEIRELNEKLQERIEEYSAANASLRDSRRAALNVMEDAVIARRQAEQASEELRQSEEQFRTLADAIPQLCWMANADGWIFWYNRRWYEYTGTTPEQMEGWGWQSVHDPEVLPSVMERWSSSIATGRPFDMVFPLRGADGVFRPFLTRILPVRDQEGRVVRWFGTNTDVAEQRRAQEELRRSNDRLNLLAETTSRLLLSEAPQEIVDSLCQRVLEYLDCQAFFNYLADEERGMLRLNAYAGIPDEEAKRIEWLDYGVAVCGCAARDACRIIAHDIADSEDPRVELVKSYRIKAYVCHPLMAQGRVLGTLSFGTCTRSRFTDDEIAVMKTVADQVAVAMERKRMEESLRRAHDLLEQRVQQRTEELAATVETLLGEIAQRERAEASLSRLNHLYAVVSEIDQAIVRAVDRDSIFRDFCRIAVEQGGFLLAWVGVVDPHTARLQTVAASGTTEYLDDIRISAEVEPEGEGPTGISLRNGTYYICNDFQNDPCTRPWHERGRRYGMESSASIALKEEGEVIGALTLYAAERDFFDPQHVALLQQMGTDISFALDNLLREERRRNAEQALQAETLERLRAMEDLREKERMLIQQSRQAALGEMIGNIAHQWRQPLNAVGLMVQELPMAQDSGELTPEYLQSTVSKVMQVIFHMSQTIDDFRLFFRPDKEKVSFNVGTAVEKVLSIIGGSLQEHEIEMEIAKDGEPAVNGYANEFSQVLLNILLNARDAFKERNVENPRIMVKLFEENGRSVVTIDDNAGGIPSDVIDKIFDPYFTTKGPDKGTGVGLYMSKVIIEKNMNGRLTARNTDVGAQFRIESETTSRSAKSSSA